MQIYALSYTCRDKLIGDSGIELKWVFVHLLNCEEGLLEWPVDEERDEWMVSHIILGGNNVVGFVKRHSSRFRMRGEDERKDL
ncbi:hypothetical protein L6452_39057 [Arctium lappa]|uniref:Uncharacterized protein n=1 Tax=Arctium lappa TaxID=4217 RepID=A0ACB8XSF4_ARCLA|nr:hypothetical protein L6452_39057 [Arctium lappa]